jgi:hypothetical protein
MAQLASTLLDPGFPAPRLYSGHSQRLAERMFAYIGPDSSTITMEALL